MTDRNLEESEIVRRLLSALGIQNFSVLAGDKPDVVAVIDNRRIGIEVTIFHVDEDSAGGGSKLRAAGEKKASSIPGAITVSSFPVNPYPGLQNRLTDKVSVARDYDGDKFDELWLLVVAQYPRNGAVTATFIVPDLVSVDTLNRQFGGLLASSPFKKVYLHLLLNKILFSWSRDDGWEVAGRPAAKSDLFTC